MNGQSSYEFNFPSATQGSKSRIAVTTPPGGDLKFYDISNPSNPRIIAGTAASLIFSRPNNAALKLLATTTVNVVPQEKVNSVQFTNINRSAYDYLIISNNTLLGVSGEFADYRKNVSPGRKYLTGVFNITDLYNQFNYGEPSPLAIRRFVDYMISDGNKDKYLLLMGKAITRNERMVKEIPDEVPTWAFPGSDLLLVDGLQGTPTDVPSVPIGRIPAINYDQAKAYLAKVISYETTTNGLGWRKNVLHVGGGKTDSELIDHSFNLSTAAAKVTAKGDAGFKGQVFTAIKPVATSATLQLDTLNKYVNYPAPAGGTGGVGLITYFGHSSPYQTDFNFGYISDPAKQFSNPGRYPIMFYNGCDIMNVFANNFDVTYNLTTSRPQSLDWLLTANKGAVAVFGNSWSGYAESCNRYLAKIYDEFFTKTDLQRQTLGKILQTVAQQTKSQIGYRVGFEGARIMLDYDWDQAQVHQTLLLGDPALRILLTTEGGLPVDLVSFDARTTGPQQVTVSWKTASEENNSHFVLERSYNAKNFEELGRIEGKGDTSAESNYSYIDNKPLAGKSYYRLKQVDNATKDEQGNWINGKETISRIVSVDRVGTQLLNVFPNPAIDKIAITLDAPVKVASWSVLDAKGTVKKSGSGTNVEVSSLTTGEYILKIVTANEDVYFRKIVKK
jgi:hypothetical protein